MLAHARYRGTGRDVIFGCGGVYGLGLLLGKMTIVMNSVHYYQMQDQVPTSIYYTRSHS